MSDIRGGSESPKRREPFVERREGPADRRATPRPEWPGRRLADHLRVVGQFRCRQCNKPFFSEVWGERFQEGDTCTRCGGSLEETDAS